MTWNPYQNAIVAVAYIWGVGLLINRISSLHHDTPDNLVGSMSAISLVVLSVAVMAFLFFFRPIVLLLEDKKKEAFTFFLKTLATFGAVTLLTVSTLLY